MDIVSLIEALKPLDHVITVKVDNSVEFGEKFMNGVISFAPTFIGFVALIYSKIQFDKSSKQQARFTHLNARISTDIDIIKQKKTSIQNACSEFLSLGREFHSTSDLSYKLRELEGYSEEKTRISWQVLELSEKYLSAKISLEVQLSTGCDKQFIDAINKFHNYISKSLGESNDKSDDKSDGDYYGVQFACIEECRNYMSRCDEEIKQIVNEFVV